MSWHDLPNMPQVRGELRREVHGRRLFILRMVNCGKATCRKCADGRLHGPYWYEISTRRNRHYWHYRGRADRFVPADFVALAQAANNEEDERRRHENA